MKFTSARRDWLLTLCPDWHMHVEPNNDLLVHERSEECACLPQVEAMVDNNGDLTPWWMVSHNAWDGRE